MELAWSNGTELLHEVLGAPGHGRNQSSPARRCAPVGQASSMHHMLPLGLRKHCMLLGDLPAVSHERPDGLLLLAAATKGVRSCALWGQAGTPPMPHSLPAPTQSSPPIHPQTPHHPNPHTSPTHPQKPYIHPYTPPQTHPPNKPYTHPLNLTSLAQISHSACLAARQDESYQWEP